MRVEEEWESVEKYKRKEEKKEMRKRRQEEWV